MTVNELYNKLANIIKEYPTIGDDYVYYGNENKLLEIDGVEVWFDVSDIGRYVCIY